MLKYKHGPRHPFVHLLSELPECRLHMAKAVNETRPDQAGYDHLQHSRSVDKNGSKWKIRYVEQSNLRY